VADVSARVGPTLAPSTSIGSYRFEMKYTAPTAPAADAPGALDAAANSIARIADIKTSSDTEMTGLKTTYTVGVASCEAPAGTSTVAHSCTIQVDMRSPRLGPLRDIRGHRTALPGRGQ
jgi:hypothetical protein